MHINGYFTTPLKRVVVSQSFATITPVNQFSNNFMILLINVVINEATSQSSIISQLNGNLG